MAGVELQQGRELLPTRQAPGVPEVHDDGLAREHHTEHHHRRGDRERDPARRIPQTGTSSNDSVAGAGGGVPTTVDTRGRRRTRGASANAVPSAITPPPIQSHKINGLTRTPNVMRCRAFEDDSSVR